uniref:Steroid 5-alpha reductase C-terminal domain-containing protein n=1 Tax=Odontella aurita TaxID=265563 RepID=A0A7S4K260_9STRA|mmetsp:Transcript_59912/g.177637  ORF Transcript_59912/g.177637 Transcript_59912/m.177637 type:complete len:411 (+) Transcript_59912:224-1456(+)
MTANDGRKKNPLLSLARRPLLALLLLLWIPDPTPVAAVGRPSTRARSSGRSPAHGLSSSSYRISAPLNVRGGGGSDGSEPEPEPNPAAAAATTAAPLASVASALAGALRSGPHVVGVAALFALSALAVVPLCQVHRGWAFSAGYGAAVALAGLSLLSSFDVLPPIDWTSLTTLGGIRGTIASLSPAGHLAVATALYGMRLTSYILLREFTVDGKSAQTAEADEGWSRAKRVPLALSVSAFYAFLVSPVMYALRGDALGGGAAGGARLKIVPVQWASVGLAYAGLILEAEADRHKYAVKRRSKVRYHREATKKDFVGPTGGTYALCRHPNYFGHVLFWSGLFLGGVTGGGYGMDPTAWISGGLGYWGILSVMRGAAGRLEKKQEESYGGQPMFDEWRGQVRGSLAPSFLGG